MKASGGRTARRRITAALVGAMLVVLSTAPVGPASADATVRTWDGGGGLSDDRWSNPAKWVGDVAPAAGDALVFPPSDSLRFSTSDIAVVFSSLTSSPGAFIHGLVRVAGPVTTGAWVAGGHPSSFIAALTVEDDLTITAMSDLTIPALRVGGHDVHLSGNRTIDAGIRAAATPGSVEVAMQEPGIALLAANPADQDPGTPVAATAVPARVAAGTVKFGYWGGDIVVDGGAVDLRASSPAG